LPSTAFTNSLLMKLVELLVLARVTGNTEALHYLRRLSEAIGGLIFNLQSGGLLELARLGGCELYRCHSCENKLGYMKKTER
jgi:hypothetical protein